MSRKHLFLLFLLICLGCWFTVFATAEPLTLPVDERPKWVRQEGIVMAGSWEPLLFRVRRDGSEGYTPTPEQRDAYIREHSSEMVVELKNLGVNFVMMHCYKGFGLEAEHESMADAVRFSKLCHDAGLRVGVYNYSGAFGWELLFKEVPEAKDWVVLDQNGEPKTYSKAATYRYYWNRNHPDAQAFYRNLVRFAVDEIKTDLVHFDNYAIGPGKDANSVQRFRDYLRETFTPEQHEQMGIRDLDTIQPPMTAEPRNLLRYAWLEFSCKSLADSYHEMSRYARGLRKDILVECNPGGVGDRIRPPIDHGRLLQGGEAFWDEGRPPGYQNGQLQTRIRTYKVARRMNNMAFVYTTTPLEMAESMAFNLDCLGCICWFEYGRLVAKPGSDAPVSKDLAPFIRFFHTRRDLFRNATVVADIAVLRSFPSQVFADPKHARLTARVEQTLIENRMPFQIIYDHQLNDLKRYRCLVLAGCIALSNRQITQIERYVESGGRLCTIGLAGTHTARMFPRKKQVFTNIPSESLIRITEQDDFIAAIRKACGDEISLSIEAPKGLCAEITEQSGRRLVHLVNYRSDGPVENIKITLHIPPGKRVRNIALAGPLRKNDAVLAFEERNSFVEFTVPTVHIYEIARIALE